MLVWVPAHVDSLGGERVDKSSNQAVNKENIDIRIRHCMEGNQ